MLQDVAALKVKDNLYFLISPHTQSDTHIWTQSVPHKNWMKDCSAQHFVSSRTFDLKECISVNIAITVIFNLNINHVYAYSRFSKTCYFKYLNV